jgi:hypothetical protein
MFKKLKGNQGVGKLLPTRGCITGHNYIACTPTSLDPVSLGWQQLQNGHCVPCSYLESSEAVVELVKCSCVILQQVQWMVLL